MSTNPNGIFVFGTFTNSIGATGDPTWTGLNQDWTTAGGCGTDWNNIGSTGRYGVDNTVDSTVLNGGNINCSNGGRLSCVQQ